MTWMRTFRRAGRRTNAALFLMLAGAFLTGWIVFAAGTPIPATLATVAHGLFGLGIVALVPWKSVIVRRSAKFPWPSWALMVVIVLCLAAGFLQFFVGYHVLAGLSPIQVHVGAALVAIPLFGWHILRRRQQRLRRSDLSRRALLRTGAFTLAIGAAYAAGAAILAPLARGSAGRVSTGSGRLAANAIPATIWLLDRVPDLDGTHRVDVAGRSLSTSDLEAAAEPVLARLDCTSGWYAEATWTGARIADLIPAERLARATSIEVTSVTGYTRRFGVEEAGELWLATRCEGQPLSAGTGAPVRLVAPHRRGFWWVKWVGTVRLSDQPAWLQLPFPPQ